MKKSSAIFLLSLLSTYLYSSVEHKDEFIDVYLSNISGNMEEKTEILKHIEKNLNGTFIDIGTGGDAIALLVKNLPKNSRPTLIAADIDPLVLESVKKRRPEINQYISGVSGPKVELVAMSAVNMNTVKDSSIAGVSASALMHEVFSYVTNRDPIDQFASEICRVLEKEGVFVYRDPKWVDDPQARCNMIIKKEIAKYYTTLFLTKFLDRDFSMLRNYRDECSKPRLYSKDDVKVNAYVKGTNQFKQMGFVEFLNMPSRLIDYAKDFSIEAPKGLLAEIQRHYIMFVVDYFAPAFIAEHHFQKDLPLANLSQDEKSHLLNYANKKRLPMKDDLIKKEDFSLYFKELNHLALMFREELKIPIEGDDTLLAFFKNRSFDHINRNLFFLQDNVTMVIDPKMLVLLFHGKDKDIFPCLKEHPGIPWDILEHLKLEGEEHYFYKTKDELITYFGQISQFLLKETHKKNYILSPLSVEEIKEVPRDFYKSVLKRDMTILDAHGNVQEPVTEKNVIHFCLQPEKKAIEIYDQLLLKEPNRFPVLAEWLSNLKKRNHSDQGS